MARRSLVGAVLLALVVAVWTPMAAADDAPPYVNPVPPIVVPEQPTVAPVEEERGSGVVPTSATVLGTSPSRGGLPLTGGDVIGLFILGAGLAGVGLVLRAGSRRRAPASV